MSHPSPHIDKVSILGQETICLGFHIFDYLVRDTLSNFKASTYVIVTDTHLQKLYLDRFQCTFNKIAKELAHDAPLPRLLTYVIPPGENSKSRAVKAEIEDYFLAQGCTRDTLVFAMGGGVIGDLVGFVAATFMRGIPFVQIPTTLLAMVDSSIGGKTAIDTPQAKNSIGAFWQPKRIFIDLAVLETLPEREFVNGMAEVIKTAAIWNESDFVLLENGAEAIRDAVLKPVRNVEFQGATLETRTPAQQLLLKVVMASVAVKSYVVTHDERETGMRGLLNFGHSIGHAIEGLVTPKLLHGECVAIGMIKEAEIARHCGYLSQVAVGRLSRCIQAYGLPITMEDKFVKNHIGNQYCTVDELMQVLRVDKKNMGSQKRIVMLSGIGKTLEQKPTNISDDIIRKVLAGSTIVHPRPINVPPVTLSPPGSKSISNRALVLAALGKGTCRLTGLLHSDDTQVMLTALTKLGAATFEWENNGDTLVVHGNGGKMHIPDSELYMGNAGTAARFLTTVSVLVPPSTIPGQKTILTGNSRMKQRPIAPLIDALTTNGSELKYLETKGCLPLEVTPFSHGLAGGEIQLAASISSQYVSSILLCAPYATKEPVTLVLTGGQVISQPYIDMTIAMMKSFGITVEALPNNTYRIPQGTYVNPAEYLVEADASSATYPLAIAAITGTTCTVPNIGSTSLQGDAGFAVNVLRPMGCTVVQTETSTTVTGPPIGTLRPLPHIDMETMTDAFLTASVLAAVTQPATSGGNNVTKISGIANQRVKECNRIAAMMHELGKFGVVTSEFDDGIIVHGHDIASLSPPKDGVKCYDDHRVAMSFSVLANVIPGGTIIREKKCVEKTWPTWWDDLENKLGGRTSDIDLGPPSEHHDYEVKSSPSPSPSASSNKKNIVRNARNNATIVVIGMRGAGKTSMGRFAAKALKRPFEDVDQYFEKTLSTTIPEFIKEHGWAAFREKEAKMLVELLVKHPSGYVISCGGGIVETASSREAFKNYAAEGGIVLHLVRNINEIEAYLNRDTSRPMYGESMRDVWARREGWYRECCNYEFVVAGQQLKGIEAEDAKEWALVESNFERFLKVILTNKSSKHANRAQVVATPTFFLSLTFSDISPALPHLSKLTLGSDAIELRVDLLRAPEKSGISFRDHVAQQVSLLRRHSDLPILFTVRSVSQGGLWPDSDVHGMISLLNDGLGWGVEYLDIEIGLPRNEIDEVLAGRGNTLIVASWHDVKGTVAWSSDAMENQYMLAKSISPDVIKLIGAANSMKGNFECSEFAARHTAKTDDLPLISMNMGAQGQLSRILNNYLTPVTHKLLPVKAAPGQLSAHEILIARHIAGLLPAKQFYLFGTPISQSLSPLMHNTSFQSLGLPYTYGLHETATVDESVVAKMRSADFGGASVTIPHKIEIMSKLDEITDEAKAIGAVNTIVPIVDRQGKTILVGDNTDWLGIYYQIVRNLSSTTTIHPQNMSGLVIGAGGTSRAALYALYRLGVQEISIFNRTMVKAQAVADSFKNLFTVKILSANELLKNDDGAGTGFDLIISTVPGTIDSSAMFDDSIFGSISEKDKKGVAVELAYTPRFTRFLKLAAQAGWATVEGGQVLVEQGGWQALKWVGRKWDLESVLTQMDLVQAGRE
ncbi:Shikimate dehydrogenase [Lobosporangium transversale]|uniref:Pentafunctional AROM polypeptide n=1 Tax=Lobosporangium transversale TaxID=64571 RepID=A0A1Y2GE11_9FUNG|nr:Shikimate dehydrogenase [Lobosporangium transversale]ORZ06789.1 Shikimate dehydrogenase [Lobosporangium transversale]|eukprot:XP_021877710.1 Shikimate dehydrogenase [Lobosporangium transversale]